MHFGIQLRLPKLSKELFFKETDVFQKLLIQSVDVKAMGIQDRTIIILDSTNNIVFEKYYDKFVETPIREWKNKFRELETMLTIDDVKSVDHYLKIL